MCEKMEKSFENTNVFYFENNWIWNLVTTEGRVLQASFKEKLKFCNLYPYYVLTTVKEKVIY